MRQAREIDVTIYLELSSVFRVAFPILAFVTALSVTPVKTATIKIILADDTPGATGIGTLAIASGARSLIYSHFALAMGIAKRIFIAVQLAPGFKIVTIRIKMGCTDFPYLPVIFGIGAGSQQVPVEP